MVWVARVALLRMADGGLLALPAPRHGNANGRIPRRLEPDPEPPRRWWRRLRSSARGDSVISSGEIPLIRNVYVYPLARAYRRILSAPA